MKKIIYTRPDGGLSVVHPAEGARLAASIKLADGTELQPKDAPKPVDTFLRHWPVEGATAEWAETEDEFLARIAKKDVPADAIGVQIVEESAIPADRTFREAWKANGGGVDHDMAKCREIHRQRLRDLRAPLLKRLDIEYMKASEKDDRAGMLAIAARKQRLRDVTIDPRLEVVTTPEELKLVIPEALTPGFPLEPVNGG